MKILQIGNNFRKSGGSESVFFNTIELLEGKRHRVIPFSLSNSKDLPSPFSKYFVDTETFLHNKLFSFESRNRLRELLKVEKPEIAHIHNIIGGVTFSILPVLKEQGIPIVATIHDFRLLCPAYIFINGKNEICEKCKTGNYFHSILNQCSPLGFKRDVSIAFESYLRDFFQSYEKLIDSFIFVSKFQQNKFLEVNPEIEIKSNQIYNFTNRFDFNSSKGDYFLYFGRLTREKSIFTLLKAFKDLSRFKLLIVGEGYLEERINKERPDNVELLGYRTGADLERIIKASSFVVASSECFETNSMVTVEAFSLGKPVIGSDIGALSELINSNNTGFLYEPKNVSQLKTLIVECSELNIDKYKQISKNAYDYALQNFSPDGHYDELIKVYKKLLKQKIN